MSRITVIVLLSLATKSFLVNFGLQKQIKSGGETIFDKIDTCGFQNLPMVFEVQNLISENRKLIMNTTITLKRDVIGQPKFYFNVTRCKDKDVLDTCELFYVNRMNRYCVAISSSALWGSFFSKYEPNFRCPLKKGLYVGTDNVLDNTAILMFPGQSWFWKTRIEIYEEATGDMISCIGTESQTRH